MIDITLVRQHLKADPEPVEDALIEQYIASAQTICEGYCNRKFYATPEDKADALLAYPAQLQTIKDEYDARIENVPEDDNETRSIANSLYATAIGELRQRINGVVVDNTIRAALLMTIGHLYKNRQDVITGQNASATKVPIGAQRILQPYLWIGNLA